MHPSVPKLLLKILAIIGISILSLLVLLYVFIQLPVGRNILKNILEDTLSEALQSDISIGSIKTNIFSRLSARDLSLDGASTGSSSLEIGSVVVHYNIFKLIYNKLDISSVKIDALSATILRDEKGEILLPQPKASGKKSSKSLQISLSSVKLSDSSIRYHDQDILLDGTIQDIEIYVKHSLRDSVYAVTFRAREAGAFYLDEQFTLENFLLNGTYKESMMHVDTLSFVIDSMQVDANAEIVLEGEKKIHGKLLVQGDPAELMRKFVAFIPPELHTIRTDLTLDVNIDGSLNDPELHAHVSFPEMIGDHIDILNGKIDALLTKDSIHVQELYCAIFDGSLSAQGGMRFDQKSLFDVGVNLSGIEYDQLWQFINKDESSYKGTLSGNLAVSGEMNSILSSHLKGQITIGNIHYNNKYIKPLVCAFSYNKGDAEYKVTQDSSLIAGNFHLHDPYIYGSVSVNINDVEHLAGLFNLTGAHGELHAQAQFDGELQNPSIQAQINGTSLSYMGIPVDTINADVQYEDSTLFIERSAFAGTIDSMRPLTETLADESIEGSATFEGSLRGSLDGFSGSLTVHADSILYSDFIIPAVSLECHAMNADVTLDLLHVAAENLTCDVQGEMSFAGRKKGNFTCDFHTSGKYEHTHCGTIQGDFEIADSISCDAQLHELSLEMLGAVSDSLSGIQGLISGALSFHGDLHNPNGTIQLTVDKPSYKDLFIDMISLDGNVTPDGFVLNNGKVQLFKNDIRFRGKLGFDRSDSTLAINQNSIINGEISISNVALKDFAEEFLDAVQAKGTLTSSVQVSGTLGVPKTTGSARIDNGFVQLDKHKSPIENLNMTIVLADSSLYFNRFTGLYEKKDFTLSGEVVSQDLRSFEPDITLSISGEPAIIINGYYNPDEMDISVIADTFDVSFVEVIPVIMNAQGYLNASVNLQGSPTNPRFRGWLKASSLEVLPEELSTPFTQCALDISATDERLDITTCSCKFGEGTIKISGYVSYGKNNIQDIAINLQAQEISLKEPKKYEVNVKDCELNYTQQKIGYSIDGTVNFGKTKYLEDIQITKLLDSMKKSKIFHMPTPVMMQTKLNVRITDSKDIWIENNLARVKAKADLVVIGTLAQPNITGRLEVTEGYIVYLDRKFEITRGVLDFTDPNMINPILDVQAETDIRNYSEPDSDPYHIIISISGPADKAKITLESVPVLDETNILSLLTFGTTHNQIFSQTPDKYDTSLKDILLERAEQYSSQRIAGFVAGRMAQMFDLDDVSIEGNLFDFGDSWGPQLVASKQLSKRMKVTYSTRVGYMNEQSIELDYKLTDHLYLQGQADQDGNAGIDMIYKVKFK